MVALVLGSFPVMQANAGLSFPEELLKIEAEIGAKEATAVFAFRNDGPETVKIEKIDSSCGCLRADSDRRIYEPGESGTITAVFSTKGNPGVYKKTLTVQSRGAAREKQTLTVHVDVPSLASLEPRMVRWKLGDAPESKRIEFTVEREDPIHIREVSSSRDTVRVTLETLEAGRRYALVVTPDHTREATVGVVKIDTDCDVRSQRRMLAFFRID